jgi:hypothetical protein
MSSHRLSRPSHLGRRLFRATNFTAVAVLAVSGSALAFSGTASAAAPEVYDLTAQAVALDSTTNDPGIPLGIPFVVGSYGAASHLNSNGESVADAGAPYSPLIYSLPSTGNGVASSSFGFGFPTVPTFPGYVIAKDPVAPTASQNAGGYDLTATADPSAAIGRVGLGVQAATSKENNFFAYAISTAGEDGVLSSAAAGVHALTLDGIIDIANVSTHASLTGDGYGGMIPSVSTDLGTISFAGLTTGLTGAGATAFGTEPTPISVENLDALNAALEPSGISLTYLPTSFTYSDGSTTTGPTADPKKKVSGLTSGALRVVMSNTSDRGTTTETITIGRVQLTAVNSSFNAGGSAGAATAGAAGGAAGTVNPGSTASGVDLAGTPAVLPVTAPGAGLLTGTGSIVAGALPVQTLLPATFGSVLPEGTSDLGSAYLVLAAVAAAALVGGQAVRLLAVRGH